MNYLHTCVRGFVRPFSKPPLPGAYGQVRNAPVRQEQKPLPECLGLLHMTKK